MSGGQRRTKARTPRRGGAKRPEGGGEEEGRRRGGGSITPLGRSPQGGGEGVTVDPMMISLVLRFQSAEV